MTRNDFLFITDLDHTLVGDDLALNQLNQYLSQHRQEYGTKIVYATGRSLYLYRQLTEEKSLLNPDALITAVGTEIYFNPNHDKIDSEWAAILSQGWNRPQIATIANTFSELIPQPESEQNPFKISYYLNETTAKTLLPQLQTALDNSGLKTKLVYSGSHDLDILPLKGDKGLAVQYLRQKWQIPPEKTAVSGDSGNDIALLQGQEKGIIVGNAKIELKKWYENNATPNRYFAKAHYAAGIIEGLKHFRFLKEE